MPVIPVPDDDPIPSAPVIGHTFTPPSISQYAQFIQNPELSSDEEAWAERGLRDGALLLSLATGISDDPKDAPTQRLVANAIMDMAQYLTIQRENAPSLYTPFSSERIGSYAYDIRMQTARYNQARGHPTGVMWFDMAVIQLQNVGSLVQSDHVVPDSPEYPIYTDAWAAIALPDSYGR